MSMQDLLYLNKSIYLLLIVQSKHGDIIVFKRHGISLQEKKDCKFSQPK